MSDDLNILIDPELVEVVLAENNTVPLDVCVSEFLNYTTELFVNQSISAHNLSNLSHQDIRDLIARDNNILSAYAALTGAIFTGNIFALNLTGTNTGDQDLSPFALSSDLNNLSNSLSAYSTLSGSTFYGDIFATNLTGTNTGDQDLSSFALSSDLNNLSNSLSAYALQTFVTSSISEHNISNIAHNDIRELITELSGNDTYTVTISAPIVLDVSKQYAFRPTSTNSIKNGIFEEVKTPNPLQIRDLITGILFNMNVEDGVIVLRDTSLILYEGGISNTIYVEETIDGGNSGTLIYDIIIDAGNSQGILIILNNETIYGSDSIGDYSDIINGGDSSNNFDNIIEGGNSN